MEVLQDTYKDTKIGRIPKDWEVVMLKDVCKVITSGFSFDVFERSKIDDGVEVLFTKVSDMNLAGNERIITDSVNKGLFSNEFVSSNSVLKPNSLIFPKRGAAIKTNKKRINGKHIILDPNLIAVSFYDEGTVNYLFTYYYFVNFDLMKIVEDGTIPQINKRDIEPFKIPLPPLKEQQKIAAILSTVDEQISTTDKIIDKSKELKKGLMQKLFSEGIGHTEFKDTKIGRIPKDWEVRNLNKCCGINKDSLSSSTKEDYSFYYLDLSLVKKGIIDFPNAKVDFKNAPSRARRKIKKGDILMSTVRPNLLGNGYINFDSEEYIASTGFAVLSNYKETNGEFLYHYLYSHNMQSQIERMLVGSNYPAINNKDVSILKIPFPLLKEQQKIATILSEIDAKIEKEQTQKAQLEQLKKGLMQQLLTGKKRVTI
jgi:type I restriction enzyme S subunit